MDASCKIQGSIHVLCLIHKSMCPGFWVHITLHCRFSSLLILAIFSLLFSFIPHLLYNTLYFSCSLIIVILFLLYCHILRHLIIIFSNFMNIFNRKIRTNFQWFHDYSSLSNNTDGFRISIGLYPFKLVIARTPLIVRMLTICLKFHDTIQSHPHSTATAIC